ncbi:MAG: cysteine--tRNA ligase [Candidatus Bathyarchaeota archaeon]
MTLQVFNTLTRKIELLIPKNEGKIELYVCGPTVYDYSHIGHARTYIAFDVIVRYLRYRGFEVRYVVNITNVEDKIIKRAQEIGVDPIALADKFEGAFYQDMENLGVVPADLYPRVSDNIGEIIHMVQVLIQKEFGYVLEGDVYFDVSKFRDYGHLSRQSLDGIKAGARVEVDERKRSPADFALWKRAKEGEICWESPWGKGRPGWHIECSAMANKHLSSTFDLHGGGQDLIFPHHENEIAQSEAYTGEKPVVKYWLHSGLLTINGEKMSKSLGNFILIKDLLQKYDAEVIRLFILSTHYRRPIDFTDVHLERAKQHLMRIRGTIENIQDRLILASATAKRTLHDAEVEKQIQDEKAKFLEVMDNDFNTPRALATFTMLIQIGNKALATTVHKSVLSHLLTSILELAQIFGILGQTKKKVDLSEEAKILMKEREAARNRRDWKKADELREKLRSIGLILEDLPEGTRWRAEE